MMGFESPRLHATSTEAGDQDLLEPARFEVFPEAFQIERRLDFLGDGPREIREVAGRRGADTEGLALSQVLAFLFGCARGTSSLLDNPI